MMLGIQLKIRAVTDTCSILIDDHVHVGGMQTENYMSVQGELDHECKNTAFGGHARAV